MPVEYREFPIIEYDPEAKAVIGPENDLRGTGRLPSGCVLCFFKNIVDEYVSELGLAPLDSIKTESGPIPVYVTTRGGTELVLAVPGVGAPLAAGVMEVMIAKGCTSFITCGGAGVLDSEIAAGHLLVPDSALRAEGTSYHYLPPSREVKPTEKAFYSLTRFLDSRELRYSVVKTWTTDAFFRETTSMVARRRTEGCSTVEMECAAFFAVGRFRGVEVASLLYGGDDVSGDVWDHRGWDGRSSLRRRVLELAMDACIAMGP